MFATLLLFGLCPILCKSAAVKETVMRVPFGETVTLHCESNDPDHNFLYWFVNDKNIIIGPSNQDYDIRKFNYEVLWGNLTVKGVSQNDEGIYNCVSRGVLDENVMIRKVKLVVQRDWEEVYDYDSNVNLFRVSIALSTLVIIGGVAYAGYKIWKNRHRNPSYLIPSDDEEDSGEELFRAPGTSKIPKSSSADSFETPGISTDFKSILNNTNNK